MHCIGSRIKHQKRYGITLERNLMVKHHKTASSFIHLSMLFWCVWYFCKIMQQNGHQNTNAPSNNRWRRSHVRECSRCSRQMVAQKGSAPRVSTLHKQDLCNRREKFYFTKNIGDKCSHKTTTYKGSGISRFSRLN